MGCCDDEENLLRPLLVANKDDDLIQEILVRLPVVSLLRFKSVCKSWCTLIEDPSFTDLHTKATTFNNPPSKFGSFILHAAVHLKGLRQSALIMLSSSVSSNSVCGRCVSTSEESGAGSGSSSSSISWWKTNDGLCVQCGQWSSYKVAEDDDHVFKLDTNDANDQQQQLVLKLDNFGFPSCYNFGKIGQFRILQSMVGSCNGLICLSDTYEKEDVSLWRPVTMVDVSLWNPATGQFRILPKSITINIDGLSGELRPYHLVAFGFDAETKDYKVVQVCVFKAVLRDCHCRVQVYSLSTDSWRIVEGINYLPGEPFRNQDSVLYLNGSCFFMSKFFLPSYLCIPSPVNDRFIISFDLTKEIIIPIQLPNHHQGQELYLCYLGEKLALFTAECFAKVDDYTSTCVSYKDFKFGVDNGCYHELFTIWVLNYELGSSSSSVNKKSWRQLHWFRIERIRGEWNIPRGISNDGKFALLETQSMGGVGNKKRMKLVNLVTYQVKKNFLSCNMVLSKANTYKPSLVSIIGGNGCSGSSSGYIG